MIFRCTNAPLTISPLTGCATQKAAYETDSIDAGRYSHLMHNRSYKACTQPKAVAVAQGKIPVPVDVQIDRNGRVQD
jgi:hypothetical protein